MLKVMAKVRAKDGCTAPLLGAAEKLVAATRTEEGNRGYELWQSANDNRTLIFDEIWDSVDAWSRHVQTPHLREFKAATEDMIESSQTIAARPKAGRR